MIHSLLLSPISPKPRSVLYLQSNRLCFIWLSGTLKQSYLCGLYFFSSCEYPASRCSLLFETCRSAFCTAYMQLYACASEQPTRNIYCSIVLTWTFHGFSARMPPNQSYISCPLSLAHAVQQHLFSTCHCSHRQGRLAPLTSRPKRCGCYPASRSLVA